jgi:hypothetical protein
MEKSVWLALVLLAIPACSSRHAAPPATAKAPPAAVAKVAVTPAQSSDTVMKRPIKLLAWLDIEDDKGHAERAENTLRAKALLIGADDVVAIEQKEIDGKTHFQGAAVKYGKKKVRMSKEMDRLLKK